MQKAFFSALLVFFTLHPFAQSREIDSIKLSIAGKPRDTTYVKDIVNLGWMMRSAGAYDSSLAYERKGQAMAEALGFRKQVGKALTICGVVYMDKGAYDSAQWYYLASLRVREEIGDKKGIAACYNNLGNLYENWGNLPRALQMQLTALRIREELKDKKELASSYNNLGNIYVGLKNYEAALQNFELSIRYKQELGDALGMAMTYGNIGLVHQLRDEYDKALENYLHTLAMEKELGYKIGLGDCYNNIGQAYYKKAAIETMPAHQQKWLDSALINYERARRATEEIGEKKGIATAYTNLGAIYSLLKKDKLAEEYSTKALKLAGELAERWLLQDIHKNLSELFARTGRHQQALAHFKASVAMRDSISNEANTKKTVQLEMQYEFDKKAASAKLEKEKKEAVAAAERKRHRIILWSISAFGMLVLIFALFAYRSFLQKKRANEEITRQKEVIEEKQKEIVDSIHYARRIQRSLLTSERYIRRNLDRMRGGHS